jgi:hypothetical protein
MRITRTDALSYRSLKSSRLASVAFLKNNVPKGAIEEIAAVSPLAIGSGFRCL